MLLLLFVMYAAASGTPASPTSVPGAKRALEPPALAPDVTRALHLQQCRQRAGSSASWAFVAGLLSERPRNSQCPPNGYMNPCSVDCQFQECCGNQTFTWYGDSCNCPYDCINCNGGFHTVLPTQPSNPEGYHQCVCSAGYTGRVGTGMLLTASCSKQGINCLECTDGGCPDPQLCSHDVFFNYHQVYDCLPSAAIQPLFPGRFIWEANFPVDGGPGSLSMTMFQNPTSGPQVTNCSMTDCSKTYGDSGEEITCQNSICCTNGWIETPLAYLFNMVHGPSVISMNPDGTGAMHQISGCMPMALTFECKAYQCVFPGQQLAPMSIGERFALIAAGVAAALMLVAGVLAVFVRSYKLRQRFTGVETQVVPVTLAWQGLSCHLQLSNGRSLQTLRDVSGVALPGTVLALLGESGAGKTSLLDTLAGRKTFGVLDGTITVNGRARGDDWRRISAYCMQDDLFVPTMTARECVLFSARMRLPALMNDEEREARTTAALQAMGLTHVEHSLVGDATHKGISGGERKRLAIACELVTNPSVLFLDEPSSGLDSANALRVLRCLHSLARTQGINVVLSIHQPDSALYALFDNVHVLAKGRLVYAGPSKQLVPFVESLGHQCPPQYNPADFVIHTVAAIEDPEELDNIAHRNATTYREPERGPEGHRRAFEHQLKLDPTVAINFDGTAQDKPLLTEREEELERRSRDIGAHSQSWIIQFLYLARRSLVAMWRSRLLATQYALVVACGLLLGALFFQLSLETTGAQNRTGVIQFVVILLVVLSLTSIDTFFAQRQLYLREKSSGYYSASAYFLSMVATDVIFLRLVPPVLLASVMYWMCGLHPGTGHFLWFTLLLVCTAFTGVSICLLISVVTPTVGVGNLIGILILLFSILFEGLLLNAATIPNWLVFLRYLSFVNYSFEALMLNEFLDLTLNFTAPGSTQSYPVNGAYFIVKIGLNPTAFFFDMSMLIALGTVLFVAAFVLLTSIKETR